MDYLGIAIAFITVMLLLSIVVMGLVQVTQSILRLRGRNLAMGIAGLLLDESKASVNDGVKEADRFSMGHRAKVKNEAADLLNDHMVPLIGKSGRKKKSNLGTYRNVILGVQRSWIEPEDLKDRLVDREVLDETDADEFVERFSKIDGLLSNRFQYFTRWATVFWAIVVAVGYQVSTPTLVSDLLAIPSLVERAQVIGDELNQESAVIQQRWNHEFVGRYALDQMKTEYPQHFELLDELVAIGWDRSDVVGELEIAVENLPQAEQRQMIIRYDQILREEMDHYIERVIAETRRADDRLSQLGIRFWSEGRQFYWSAYSGTEWANIFGTLMTIILLSLGAPFWFEQLKNATKLRDVLAGDKDRSTSS